MLQALQTLQPCKNNRAKWMRVNETKVTGIGYHQAESYQVEKT